MTAPENFALLRYSTTNFGDEIQSLAARQFLPRVDAYLDRDRIAQDCGYLSAPAKVILNGWWFHGAGWPPPREKLVPLLTSMHFDFRNPQVQRAVLTDRSRDFLDGSGPVGARDIATQEFLNANGVEAFFSGCMTLTLRKDPAVVRQDYVLAVDLKPDQVEIVRSHTERPVLALTVDHEPTLSTEARLRLAELYLFFYQAAACVVTTRLHAFLPSLAFETPVLYVENPRSYGAGRFSGLADLGRRCCSGDLADAFDDLTLDQPPPNSGQHEQFRSALTAQALAFTGMESPVPPTPTRWLPGLTDPRWIAEILGDQVGKAFVWHRLNAAHARDPWTALGARVRQLPKPMRAMARRMAHV